MEAKLVVVGGKSEGREIPVTGTEFVIGRAEGCQLRPQSDRVSRRHAIIRIKEGAVTVEDCGSKNGTLVNGKVIDGEHRLKTGNLLTVGPLEFEVQLAVSVGGKKKPKVKNVQEAVARTVDSAADDDMDISAWLDGDEGADSGFRPQIVFRTKDEDDEEKKKAAKADDTDEATKPDTQDSREAATKMLRNFFDPSK